MAILTPETIHEIQRLVVRGVNWLGDAVMTTPALTGLRETFPKAHIVLLVPDWQEELWLHHTAVDAVQGFSERDNVRSVGRRLRRGNFDLALVLPNSPRSALEMFWARIPIRVGYARPWRSWMLTHPVPARPDEVPMRKRGTGEIRRLKDAPRNVGETLPRSAHQVHQYLHLVSALGGNLKPTSPEIVLTEPELKQAIELLPPDAPPPRFWLGLNAGANYGAAKRWPEERFVATAAEVHRQTGCGCILVGGANEVELANSIARQLRQDRVDPVVNLAGQTTLRQLCAILKFCQVVLTNDSGPMHVAAAVGTPVVVPFGSTASGLTGPGLPGDPRHRMLLSNVGCSPCFRRTCPIDLRCMHHIEVAQAVEAIVELVS